MRKWYIVAAGPLLLWCCATESGTGGEPFYPATPSAFADTTPAGNPEGQCNVPASALAASVDNPDRVVGNGTRASCTADAFRAAVAHGGKIVFDCGPDTMTIVLDKPAKVFNDSLPDIVIDGGDNVGLSGGGRSRILYMNTCDQAQHWTSEHCDNQATPRLTVQNLTFVDGNAAAEGEGGGGGGGAIFASGGSLKVVSCRFFRNVCAKKGADVGGGAIRAFQQYNQAPIHVVNSTFGSTGNGNVGSNGGALSSIMVNWSVWNSMFVANEAVGNGGNPADKNTPGGGSGGAIYNDGLTLTLSVCGSKFTANKVNAFGAAIFFVSNNHQGTINLTDSRISGNIGGSWHALPGIAMHEDTKRNLVNSALEN